MTEGFSTVDDILKDILMMLSTEYKEKIKKMSSIEFEVQEHFNLGLTIRNKYFHQNPARVKLIQNLGYDKDFMYLDGDEFSSIILNALYQVITTGK